MGCAGSVGECFQQEVDVFELVADLLLALFQFLRWIGIAAGDTFHELGSFTLQAHGRRFGFHFLDFVWVCGCCHVGLGNEG